MLRAKLLVGLFIVVPSIAFVGHTENSAPCAPNDENAADILEDHRWSDTTTDTATISWRQRTSLPTVPVGQIVLVSDTAICRRALNKYNNVMADSGDTRLSVEATVVKWGATRYAISDTAHRSGEWTMELFTDSSFTQVLGLSSR